VLARVAVLLDEAVGLQRLEQAVDGRPRELEALGELADAQPARPGGQRLEDRRRPIDRLDGPPARARGRWAIRHCRIHFENVGYPTWQRPPSGSWSYHTARRSPRAAWAPTRPACATRSRGRAAAEAAWSCSATWAPRSSRSATCSSSAPTATSGWPTRRWSRGL